MQDNDFEKIKKYKELLDKDVITQEEFDRLKSKLLGSGIEYNQIHNKKSIDKKTKKTSSDSKKVDKTAVTSDIAETKENNSTTVSKSKNFDDTVVLERYIEPQNETSQINTNTNSNLKTVIIVATISVVVIIGLIFGIAKYYANSRDSNYSDGGTGSYYDDGDYDDSDYDDGDSDYDNDNEYDESEDGFDSSNYIVGNTYYVQDALRVRESYSTSARWLIREELDSTYYPKSVDTEHAVLEEGTSVTCLEMNGNWMRISAGWICCYDDGEILVK